MVEMEAAESGGVLRGRYELGRVLGRGTFAKVHVARDLRTGRNVAVKVIEKAVLERAGMVAQLKREISSMKAASQHPHVVELHEVLATRTRVYLAMELVGGGELFARVSRAGRLREDVARRYFRQLVSAVAFCHARGVCHRDLKLENLLLDDRGALKVADFGLSALLRPDGEGGGLLRTTCGTPAYVAPEVLSKKGYDGAKADVWSCGVILFALLAGFLPFQDGNLALMYRKIKRADFRFPPWFSSDARRVLVRLLDPNPATRVTFAALVDSPWFKRCPVQRAITPTSIQSEDFCKKDEPERLNAFHLISLSGGFDLSPLFEHAGRGEEGMRFATREPAAGVISLLEGVAARTAGRVRVTKSSAAGVRLEGVENGGKGRLALAAEIVAVAPSVLVVEVRRDGGDAVEYRRFCSDELRPALKDIVWASTASSQPTAVA